MDATTPNTSPRRDAVSVPAAVGDGGILPEYASPDAAGADLRSSEAVVSAADVVKSYARLTTFCLSVIGSK